MKMKKNEIYYAKRSEDVIIKMFLVTDTTNEKTKNIKIQILLVEKGFNFVPWWTEEYLLKYYKRIA